MNRFKAAWDRALSARLPNIPSRDGDIQLALLAAFCRELQRDAGDRLFICPLNVVQRFFNLRELAHANNLMQGLEQEGMIRRVQHGYRYLGMSERV